MDTTTAIALRNEHGRLIKTLNRGLQSVLHIDNGKLVDATLNYGSVDKGDTSIITLTGTLDLPVATELHQLLLCYLSSKQNLIIYMSDVRHMDSAAAATLLDSYAVARGIGPGFALVAISRNARHTLSLCCLDGVLPLFQHMEDAEKHMKEHPGIWDVTYLRRRWREWMNLSPLAFLPSFSTAAGWSPFFYPFAATGYPMVEAISH